MRRRGHRAGALRGSGPRSKGSGETAGSHAGEGFPLLRRHRTRGALCPRATQPASYADVTSVMLTEL